VTRLSIGTWAFGVFSAHPLPFEKVLDRIAELRFDGVELGAFSPHPDPISCASKSDRAKLAEQFARRGLALSAVAADFGAEGFLRGDSRAYLAALDRNIAFCDDVGAKRLIVNTMDPPEVAAEIGEAVAMERLLKTWREAASRAAAHGVTLVFEFEPCWALNEPEQVISIARQLTGPGFGVLYDTAHAHIVSEVGIPGTAGRHTLPGGQVELLSRLSGTIAHIHLLDSDGSIHASESSTERTTVHVPFGHGNVDFDRVIPALVAASGKVDWWTVDLCFWPDAWGAAEACKRFADQLVARYQPGSAA
jgi:sugar phosphate isomerase/epimerase